MAHDKCFECYKPLDRNEGFEFYPRKYCSFECVQENATDLAQNYTKMYHEREALISENMKLRINSGDYSIRDYTKIEIKKGE